MIGADIFAVLPELVLAIFAMAALVWAVYTSKDAAAPMLCFVTAGLFVALAAWIGLNGQGTTVAFNGLFTDDAFARFSKVVILLSAAAVLLFSQDHMSRLGILRFEYPVLITLSVIGMMLMVSASDLMSLYMGLELQSLALYVVASLHRDDKRSTEAGLKYFVLGALSSGMLLYGASLTYGYAGTTQFAGIIEAAQQDEQMSMGLLFGLVFLIAGLAFKVSAAPFHMWTPDVYEGSPTPVTAFFSTAPKMAAMGLFARVVHDAFGGSVGEWQQILAFLSVVSMFLGSFAAIGQFDIKRLMAYSSIAHMGFALMGLASGTVLGVQAMLVYMAIYVTMNIGAFAFICTMERDGHPVSDIKGLSMLSTRAPGQAMALLVIFFSLAGVPPLVGFFGKFYVLNAAVDAGLGWLAIAGVLASVIGAFYYIRVVYYMYFGKAEDGAAAPMGMMQWVFLAGTAVVLVAGVVNLFGVEGLALAAAETLVLR